MTLPRLYGMLKYFNNNPPINELVFAVVKSLGMVKEEKKKQEQSIEEMFQQLQAAGFGVG